MRDRIRMLEERAKLSDEENNTLKKNLKASEAKNCRLMEQIKNLNEQRRQQSRNLNGMGIKMNNAQKKAADRVKMVEEKRRFLEEMAKSLVKRNSLLEERNKSLEEGNK